MKAETAFPIFSKNRSEPSWKLLAADNACVILSVLGDVFSAGVRGESDELDRLHNHFSRFPEYSWESIDTQPILAAVKNLDAQIEREKAASDKLKMLEADRAAAEKSLDEKENRLAAVRKTLGETEGKLRENRTRRSQIENEYNEALSRISAFSREHLPVRFDAVRKPKSLSIIDRVIQEVCETLNAEIDAEKMTSNSMQATAERCFTSFRSRWESECTGLTDSFDYADDYLEKLNTLRIDDLPAHETHFRDLLHSQGLQKAAALLHLLKSEILESSERMEEVNDSLSRVPFDKKGKTLTYIVLRNVKKPLPEHRTLTEDITALLNEASKPEPDDAVYEERFRLLKKISEELRDDAFRYRALDTRRQIEFFAEEKSADGKRLHTYDSGSGKSGGERLKLTSACLAAALRYQLGGETDAEPSFAPVIFDEAFDKADETKARLSLEMFRNFGFQPILVTPGKLITTIEPFVGGAFCVTCNDDHISNGVSLMYDEAENCFVRDARFSSSEEAANETAV